MRIMVYNILEGGLGRIDPICEVIRLAKADVVIVPETWVNQEFLKLADRLEMEGFQAESPRNPRGHIGLLTRLPLLEAVNYGPLDHRLTRSAFHAVIQDRSGPLGIVGVHLHPRESLADEQMRMGELAAVLKITEKLKDMPHLLAGDFNSHHPGQVPNMADAPDFIKKRLPQDARGNTLPLPRDVVSKILLAGYLDAHAIHCPPDKFDTTFTTAAPVFRLDYIFVSPDLAPRVMDCRSVRLPMTRFASDHFPVLAELRDS